MACSPPCSSCLWDSPGKNTGVGCHFLLQVIFLTQGSNSSLLHWQVDSEPPGKLIKTILHGKLLGDIVSCNLPEVGAKLLFPTVPTPLSVIHSFLRISAATAELGGCAAPRCGPRRRRFGCCDGTRLQIAARILCTSSGARLAEALKFL